MDDLLEEQRQVPFEKDAKVAREEGPVNEEKAEVKDTHDIDDMSVEEEVVMENELAEEIVKERGLVKKEKAWKKDEYGVEEIFVKGEVTIENALVEELDGIAGRNVLHKEKGDKVKPYPCKEPGCDKKFGAKQLLDQHKRSVHLKE